MQVDDEALNVQQDQPELENRKSSSHTHKATTAAVEGHEVDNPVEQEDKEN